MIHGLILKWAIYLSNSSVFKIIFLCEIFSHLLTSECFNTFLHIKNTSRLKFVSQGNETSVGNVAVNSPSTIVWALLLRLLPFQSSHYNPILIAQLDNPHFFTMEQMQRNNDVQW